MTARIEIGRLAAKDLGKIVDLGVTTSTYPLIAVHHYTSDDGVPYTTVTFGPHKAHWRSDTLIEVTGTNNKEQA